MGRRQQPLVGGAERNGDLLNRPRGERDRPSARRELSATSRRAARGGFFWRHLIGDYSLARSYWLHYVLLGWAVAFFFAWGLHRLAERGSMQSVSSVVLFAEPALLLVWMWSTFGAAVSALRHLFAGPSRFWALLAFASLVLSTFATFATLKQDGRAWREHWAIATGHQPTASFDIALRDDGRVIAYSGGINDGAAAALDKAIADAPRVGTLLLDSPGGWLREGSRMAAVVQRYRLNTRVEHECFSSCTIVLLAGQNRSAGPQALIGFHRGRSPGEAAGGHVVNESSEEFDLYRRAGLRPEFVRRIVATPNNAIFVPSLEDLRREDVLTR